MRLVFMGSPAFAVPALRALLESRHTIAAVYSQPPRPSGRGQKETPTPVHTLAAEHHIPVYTPVTLKSLDIQAEFRAHAADAAVVAAYGLLLPKPILQACPNGCINIHPSPLPRWRGAAPIQRTIMAGDRETAICIMQMDEGLDTGPVLLRRPYAIPPSMNAGELHDWLAAESAPLLLTALEHIETGNATLTPQSGQGITYAAKITKEEARIDWKKSARDIYYHILGLSPKPGAYFEYGGEKIKILNADYTGARPSDLYDIQEPVPAGTLLGYRISHIACGSGMLLPLILQRPGKKPMPAEECLRGMQLPDRTVLS